MTGLSNVFAGVYANAYDAYFQRIYTLAWVLAILTVIVAIVLHMSKRKKCVLSGLSAEQCFGFLAATCGSQNSLSDNTALPAALIRAVLLRLRLLTAC